MKTEQATKKCHVCRLMGDLFLWSLIVWLAMACDVYAYIDPGSGTFIWQTLVVAGLGALFYFRGIFRRVISWIRGEKQKQTEKHE